MSQIEKAVVTVVGRDEIGILAGSSAVCAEHRANILEVTQSVMQNIFTMVMVIDIDRMNCTIDELQQEMKGRLPNLDVHVMHENIFNSMHRI